jgi:uncharacterized pyridoxamine 5'-phosphate oxidase family protein
MEKYIKLLNENKIMSIATSCKDNPRSSIMEYIMINGKLLFMTSPETIKAKNLSKNPKISLTVMSSKVGAKLEELLYLAADGAVVDAVPKDIEAFNKVLIERYPEFKAYLEAAPAPNKYYEVVLDTVYFSEGMKPAEIIKVKK